MNMNYPSEPRAPLSPRSSNRPAKRRRHVSNNLVSLYSMTPGCSNDRIRHHLKSNSLFVVGKMLQEGYILDITQMHALDILHVFDDMTTSCAVIYAMVCRRTRRLWKIGLTTDHAGRLDWYKIDGYDTSQFDLIRIVHLDRFSEAMDAFVQEHGVRKLVSAIHNDRTCPWQFQLLLKMIFEEGGEYLGLKKAFSNRDVECGVQFYYNEKGYPLSIPAELGTCDVKKYALREAKVQKAVAVLIREISKILNLRQTITADCITAWMTAFEAANDGSTLNATKCLMEYILGRSVNLEETDTIPYPAIPNATTSKEGFSTDYAQHDLDLGMQRLDSRIVGAPHNSILLINTNRILFPGKSGNPMHDHVETIHDYRTVTKVMDDAIILVAHKTEQKIGLIHGAPGMAMHAGKEEIPLWRCVMRGCEMEVLKRVTEHFQSKSDRDPYRVPKANAVFGGYMFEYIRASLQQSKFAAAASFRHVIALREVNGFLQNNLAKTPADPNYPMAESVRAKHRPSAKPVFSQRNPLLAFRSLNILPSIVTDAENPEEIDAAITRCREILSEDCPDYDGSRWHPAYDTLRCRWEAVLNGIVKHSPMRLAIKEVYDNAKSNEGNPDARGRTNAEKEDYEADFAKIIALPWGTEFFVRFGNHDDPFPRADTLSHEIFPSFTLEGLIGRVRDNRIRQDNTVAIAATRVDVPLSVQTAQDKHGVTIYAGVNGKQSFVLCRLLETVEHHAETLEDQMQEIEGLNVGDRFWTRFDKKVSTTTSKPGPDTNGKGYTCFNMPTWVSVRDRLNKTKDTSGKKSKKVMNGNRPIKSDDKNFILLEIVSTK